MSRRDRDRLLTIAKWLGIAGLLAFFVALGMAIRDWERQRIADAVVERMREGGGK